MAKKRLNKKVALIGSAVLVILTVVIIWLFLNWTRNPEPFIKDGDAAMKAADEATDEETKKDEYDRAALNYHRARSRAKTDSLRVQLLFKLVDIYLKTEKWNNALGCWDTIVQINPKNAEARFGRLKYSYILADSISNSGDRSACRRFWQDVESQASEFLEVADANLLNEDISKWGTLGIQGGETGVKRLGSYLHLLRGRALLEITKLGAVTNRDESLGRAMEDLENVRKLEPNNVDVYWYLAQAVNEKGQIFASRGNLEERDKAEKQANEFLEHSVEVAGSDVKAYINVLAMKLEAATLTDNEQIKTLESEYLALIEKFPSSPLPYSKLAEFYTRVGHKYFDKAAKAIEKAIELDKENVSYAIIAANLNYSIASLYGQSTQLYKAIEIAKNALTLPDAQDKPGPRMWEKRINRISLYSFLANCYIGDLIAPCEVRTQSQNQEWLANAEKMVHEIEQFFGSGENPRVVKWQGMLELVKGDRNTAIRKLYATYEQFKASDQADAQLSYTLAKIFEKTSEIGAVKEFLESAMEAHIDMVKPEVILDYADLLIKLRGYDAALRFVDSFENKYWTNQRSLALRIDACVGAGQFDKATEVLTKAQPDDPNTIKLNITLVKARIGQILSDIATRRIEDSLTAEAGVGLQSTGESMSVELKRYQQTLVELVNKLLPMEPNSIRASTITAVYNSYVKEGNIEQAKDFINRCLKYIPNDITALFFKQMLAEPDPQNISQERRNEIRERVLLGMADPIQRAVNLGMFYQSEDPNKAAEEFKKVIGSRLSDKGQAAPAITPALQEIEIEDQKIVDLQNFATTRLFDIAIAKENWTLAGQIVQMARRENLDKCEGNFFVARLSTAKKQYEDALARLDECLKQRPVFSYAYNARSRINAALGNELKTLQDAQKAAYLNPLDGEIARLLAVTLYRRNLKLGDNASSAQVIETRDALMRAISLEPRNWELISFYAEYVSKENPDYALALRQRLQKAFPSFENSLLLGRMAMKMAVSETDTARKKVLFNIAASSLEQARAIEPQNETMLNSYAEYYRLTEHPEKAEELLTQSQSTMKLGEHYFKTGRLEDARKVLEQLHHSEPNNSEAIVNLLIVLERIGDANAVKEYSEKLLSLEDSAENRLIQIQGFLGVGLIKETEYKLQSFREKYPNEARIPLIEALLITRKGQLGKALELVKQSLAADQDNPGAWRLKGEIERYKANYSQAIDDLKKSIALRDDFGTHISLAKAYLQSGRNEEAIAELKSIIDEPEVAMESRELLERTYLRLGRVQALADLYRETIDKFPDNLFWYNRAAEFQLQIKNFNEAEKIYQLAWQKSKKAGLQNQTAFDGYLKALMVAGKFTKVLEEAGKYVNSELAPIALYRIAEAKREMGDKTGAIEFYTKAVDKAPDQTVAADLLQKMYAALGDEPVRKLCLEKIQNKQLNIAANFTLYNLEKQLNNYNKAIQYIQNCIDLANQNQELRAIYLKAKAGLLELAYNKTTDKTYLNQAISQYESLLKEMPNNTSVLNNLAYLLAENNQRIEDAIKYATRAYEIQPNDPMILDTYAFVLYKAGEYQKAEVPMQAALQRCEMNKIAASWDMYEHLGLIKEKLGAKNEAIAAYQQALQAGALAKPIEERLKAAIERISQ